MLSNILGNLPKLLNGLGGLFGGKKAASAATTDIGTTNTGGASSSTPYFKSDTFKEATGSLVGDVGGLMSINSSGINSASKDMGRADAAVDMVGSALSFIPGGGAVAGTALKLVNSLGSGLVSKPGAFKNFSQNQNVAASSSMGGVAANASDVASTISAFDNSGLAGRLFGRKSKNIDKANKVMNQQALSQSVMDESVRGMEQANTSADMFGARTTMNLMGYKPNNLRMGKEGMTINKKDVVNLRRALKAQQGTKILPRSTPPPTQPTPIKLLNQDERRHWDGFSDYVNTQGYGGHTGLNTGTLSRDLWKDYTSSKNLDLNYDDFIPRLQSTIATFRGQSINKMKNGFGELKDKDFKNPNFNWDNEYLPGLSKVDGWAGSNTTSFKFPKGTKVNLEKPQQSTEETRRQTMASFKEGGSINRNIIVDGALHAHKHTLKELEEFKDADITHKGIPVITMSEGGEIEQHAEVERDEIIFCIEVTEKLEALMADGSDAAKIEAGKLLTKELLFNTEDSSSELLGDG